jgi:hypothetical protein
VSIKLTPTNNHAPIEDTLLFNPVNSNKDKTLEIQLRHSLFTGGRLLPLRLFRVGKRAGESSTRSVSENPIVGGCWKMLRCKASEVLRNEAYLAVRRSDEE